MKAKVLLTAITIGMILGAYAQKPTMTLAFTADNNAQHVPLNSILIENLTQGGDTTLYAPDTILVLDYITGMEEVSVFSRNGFSLSQNYPNPMEGKTTIDLLLPESANVLLTISDIMGRELIRQENRLEQGFHAFTFLPGGDKLYILTARTDRQSRTIKMLNSPSNANTSVYCKLEYIGQQKIGTGGNKTGNTLNNFVFNLGDQLKFTAFTGLGERVITCFPSGDHTYYFHYTGEPCPGTPTVTDIDGNSYNTVQIGTQCWMKENLKTTTFRNGNAIPNVTSSDWAWLTTGAYCWFNNDSASWATAYGALYNWYTTVDTNGLCPMGWHVPTHDEWTVLTDYIGGTSAPYGDELKSCRLVNSPLGGACNTSEHPRWNENGMYYGTDDYGFSGLPAGGRNYIGLFGSIGTFGNWWSSTEYSSYNAWYRGLYFYGGFINMGGIDKQNGFNVRCLRDN